MNDGDFIYQLQTGKYDRELTTRLFTNGKIKRNLLKFMKKQYLNAPSCKDEVMQLRVLCAEEVQHLYRREIAQGELFKEY